MTRAFLQLGAWNAAFWLALWLYGRRAGGSARFALSLVCGALLARVGPALLWGEPTRLLDARQGVSVLFVPLGVLWIRPLPAALASLPLPLALARLGCLAAGCCRGSFGERLPLYEAAALVLLHVGLARGSRAAVPERFALAWGALRLAESPWRVRIPAALGAGTLATPEAVAFGWIAIGAALGLCRRVDRVTNRRRFAHASPDGYARS